MNKINKIKEVFFLGAIAFIASCTNLDEKIIDGVPVNSSEAGETSTLLKAAYRSLGNYQNLDFITTLEHSTDSSIGPTRGGDWDDNAKYRQLKTHTWDPAHSNINNIWVNTLTVVYNCDRVIDNTKDGTSENDQARFLRAFCYYTIIDMYGQVPYREKGIPVTEDPKVWTRADAITFVIKELEEIIDRLPTRVAGQAFVANKDAAHFLLAKLYLNKAVFTSAKPEGPYDFKKEDMDKVVIHVDAITSSLEDNYWKNFTPDNNTSNEILFSVENIRGINSITSINHYWLAPSHYNTVPSGWNGMALTGDLYDKYESKDKRIKYSTENIIKNLGNPIGMQIGQMYKPGGVEKVKDRLGQDLIFTKEVALIVGGKTIESAGIRGIKYEPDFTTSLEDKPENDFVLMRYADALLMKAEAKLRGSSSAVDVEGILIQIANRANATPQPATLEGVYEERAKELWLECQRRNDMIRFGKFLEANQFKPYISDAHYLLFPIPSGALFNKNLKQNPGY